MEKQNKKQKDVELASFLSDNICIVDGVNSDS